jgi:inositol 1,4,5-triphosphate receptor type 1
MLSVLLFTRLICLHYRAFGSRISFDIFFFVIIIVLLLNIIFGIIIDTFGQLREDAADRKFKMSNYCALCGLDKATIESVRSTSSVGTKNNLSFLEHVENEHNIWDYSMFLLYLKQKNPNEYLGIERYFKISPFHNLGFMYLVNL